jgi:hypothetical protein
MKRSGIVLNGILLIAVLLISGRITVQADMPAGKSKLIIYTDPCPELGFILTDPSGNSSGWDAVNKKLLRGMKNSNILNEAVEDPKPWYVLYIWNLEQGNYTLSITGTFDGPFLVEFDIEDKKQGRQFPDIEGTIKAGQSYSFILSFHPGDVDLTSLRSTSEDFTGLIH